MMRKILILFFIMILFVAPVHSSDLHNLTVDDKHIIHTYGCCYLIHTVEFGDIEVTEETYQQIWINDTITVDIKSSWGLYSVHAVNGTAINEYRWN